MDEELTDMIAERLEEHGFSGTLCEERDGVACYELRSDTPAGEDWIETVWFEPTWEGFENALEELYEGFDVDDEAARWIDCRGTRGVPDSVSALLHDAEWKKETLGVLAYGNVYL